MKVRKHEWLKSTRLVTDEELEFRLRNVSDGDYPLCCANIHIHYNGSWKTISKPFLSFMTDHCFIWEKYRSEIIKKYGVPTFASVRICNVTKQVL